MEAYLFDQTKNTITQDSLYKYATTNTITYKRNSKTVPVEHDQCQQMIEYVGTSLGILDKDQVVFDDSDDEIEDIDEYLLSKRRSAMELEYSNMLQTFYEEDEDDEEEKKQFEISSKNLKDFMESNLKFHISEMNRLENNAV